MHCISLHVSVIGKDLLISPYVNCLDFIFLPFLSYFCFSFLVGLKEYIAILDTYILSVSAVAMSFPG